MPNESAKYVFVSYNRRDEAVMRRIVSYMRGRNINVWVDNERLVPGTPIWEEEIEKAIRGAFAVIVILSPASKSSEWVRREVTLVDNARKRVFPVLITGGEEDAIPIRLITRQFVDLRKNEEEGLLSLYQAISSYRDELDAQEKAGGVHSEKAMPQVALPKAASTRSEAATSSQAMAEMVRVARERERRQLSQSKQGGAAAVAPKKNSSPLIWLTLAGGALLCVVLAMLGPLVWDAITASPSIATLPPANTNNDNTIDATIRPATVPVNTEAPTDVPIPPTLTFTPSPTTPPSPTFTFTPIPTITPLPPADPSEFIIFYFDTIVYKKDYERCWSLLTPDYQVIKTGGWTEYVNFWNTVSDWARSSILTEYNRSTRARVRITYHLYYFSGGSDLVDDVRYCLLWNDSMRTWQIDLRENCP